MLADVSLLTRLNSGPSIRSFTAQNANPIGTFAASFAERGTLHVLQRRLPCLKAHTFSAHAWTGSLWYHESNTFRRSIYEAAGKGDRLLHRRSAATRAEAASTVGTTAAEHSPVQLKAVKDEDVEKVKDLLEEKYPDRAVNSAALKNIDVLLSLGAKRAQVVRLLGQYTQLYDRGYAEALRSKAAVLMHFGIGTDALIKALYKSIAWLDSPADDVEAVLSYLDRGLGVNSLTRVATTNPDVLGMKRGEVEEIVAYLDSIQIGDPAAAVDRSPALLGNGKADVAAKLDVLSTTLKMGASDIRELIEKRPSLLLASSATIQDTYQHLVETLGEDGLKALVRKHPQILGTSWLVMEEPVQQLVTTFGKEEAGEVMQKNVSLVRRKWSSTEEKLAYLTNEMGRSVEEIKAWPAALTMSLPTKLRPRFEALKESGQETSCNLRTMFGCNNLNFERRFKVALPEKKRAQAQMG